MFENVPKIPKNLSKIKSHFAAYFNMDWMEDYKDAHEALEDYLNEPLDSLKEALPEFEWLITWLKQLNLDYTDSGHILHELGIHYSPIDHEGLDNIQWLEKIRDRIKSKIDEAAK